MTGAALACGSCLVFAITLAAHYQTIWLDAATEFVHDDVHAITNNADISAETLKPIAEIFKNDFWGIPIHTEQSHKSYRPLTVISFRISRYLAGGLNARAFHVHGVILHGLVSVLFTIVCHFLAFRKRAVTLAVCCGLLFALHPVHCEAVSSIVGQSPFLCYITFPAAFLFSHYLPHCPSLGRAEVLACLFLQLALLLYASCIPAPRSKSSPSTPSTIFPSWVHWGMFGVTLLLILFAALSKEQGLMAVVVCASYDFFVSLRLNIWELLTAMTFGVVDPFGLHKSSTKGSTKGSGASSATTHARDQLFWGRARCAAVRGLLLLFFAVGLFIHRVSLVMGDPPMFSKMENPGGGADEWITRVLTLNYYAFFHGWLLLWPEQLCHDWTGSSISLLTSLADARNLQWPLLHVGIGFLIYKAFFAFQTKTKTTMATAATGGSKTDSKSKGSASKSVDEGQADANDDDFDRGGVLALGTALLVAPFLPASNLFFTVGFPVAERVLYTPSLGFVLLVVTAMDLVVGKAAGSVSGAGKGGATKALAVTCMVAMVAAVYTRKLMMRDLEWSDSNTLYTSATEANPANGQVRMIY
jgi:hypothetical protein